MGKQSKVKDEFEEKRNARDYCPKCQQQRLDRKTCPNEACDSNIIKERVDIKITGSVADDILT